MKFVNYFLNSSKDSFPSNDLHSFPSKNISLTLKKYKNHKLVNCSINFTNNHESINLFESFLQDVLMYKYVDEIKRRIHNLSIFVLLHV